MGGTVIGKITFFGLATNRDDLIAAFDKLEMDARDKVGGEPWSQVEDEYGKKHAPSNSLSDDFGFVVVGHRTIMFDGPFVGDMTRISGGSVQSLMED